MNTGSDYYFDRTRSPRSSSSFIRGAPSACGAPQKPAEISRTACQAPWPTALDQLDSGFVVAVKKLIGNLAVGRLVGQFNSGRAVLLCVNHRDQAVLKDALDGRVRAKIF